jgi:hypothetical protein
MMRRPPAQQQRVQELSSETPDRLLAFSRTTLQYQHSPVRASLPDCMATTFGKLDGFTGAMVGQNRQGEAQLVTIASPDFGSGVDGVRKLLILIGVPDGI